MRAAAIGLAAATFLALAFAGGSAAANPHAAPGGYKLLKLSGHYVKWGDQALGSGATVTYAFVDEAMRFRDARNCSQVVPMTDLMARSGISRDALEAEAAAAFRIWEDVADITFVPVDDPATANILIGAQGRPTGRAFANVSYLPDSEHEVRIIDRALICLNPHHRWKVGFDGNTRVYDLRYTFVHEIGHAIGLDHPGAFGQVMSFRYDEKHRELQPGDLSGVTTLYGNARQWLADDTVPPQAEAVVDVAPPRNQSSPGTTAGP